MTYEQAEKMVSDIVELEMESGYVHKGLEDSFFCGYFKSAYIRLLIENDRLKTHIKEMENNQ